MLKPRKCNIDQPSTSDGLCGEPIQLIPRTECALGFCSPFTHPRRVRNLRDVRYFAYVSEDFKHFIRGIVWSERKQPCVKPDDNETTTNLESVGKPPPKRVVDERGQHLAPTVQQLVGRFRQTHPGAEFLIKLMDVKFMGTFMPRDARRLQDIAFHTVTQSFKPGHSVGGWAPRFAL